MTGPALALIAAALAIAGCGPSQEQREKYAEEKRLHCLDHICDGDVVPPVFDHMKETRIKLNGEWYIGPAEYYSTGIGGASFDWWQHKPISRQMKRPPELQKAAETGNGDDYSIEIYLARQRRDVQGPNRYEGLLLAEREGRVISKELVRQGLEKWRTKERHDSPAELWFVATQHVRADPNLSVLYCREAREDIDRCMTGFIWRPGIAGNVRFRARHASDWPEIYQEVQRVLSLLKKV